MHGTFEVEPLMSSHISGEMVSNPYTQPPNMPRGIAGGGSSRREAGPGFGRHD